MPAMRSSGGVEDQGNPSNRGNQKYSDSKNGGGNTSPSPFPTSGFFVPRRSARTVMVFILRIVRVFMFVAINKMGIMKR